MSEWEEVERPVTVERLYRTGLQAAIARTAETGMALKLHKGSPGGGFVAALGARGLRIHQRKQPDGTYLVWAEKREPTNGTGA